MIDRYVLTQIQIETKTFCFGYMHPKSRGLCSIIYIWGKLKTNLVEESHHGCPWVSMMIGVMLPVDFQIDFSGKTHCLIGAC